MRAPDVANHAASRRYFGSDERGSVISVSDGSGNALAINRYDEYGVLSFGALANQRFGFAGMMWLGQPGLHQALYRAYGQHLGRIATAGPAAGIAEASAIQH